MNFLKITDRFNYKLILILLLLFNLHNSAQPKYDFNILSQYIQNAVDSFQVPGLAVGITYKGEIVFEKGFGLRSNNSNKKVNSETLFGIASLSKAFTAASIGMLVDEGKLDWNDRVIDHLPWFELYDPYITREVRIVDLLSHRVGLATFDGDLLWYGTNYNRKEIVERIRELPIKNSLREKYGYQNIMFIVAGEVIENVSGISWEEFVENRIFKPLGMKNSTVTNSIFDENTNAAVPHLNGEVQEYINYDNSGPAASINSCVEDMLKWSWFWIKEGLVDTTRLLSKNSYNTITKSYMSLNVRNLKEIGGTHFRSTGLGWFLNDYAGRKIMSHGGGLPGFLSRITIVPEDSLGIVVFQNDMQPVYNDISKKIIDFMITDKDIDYVARSLNGWSRREENERRKFEERQAKRIENTKPSLDLNSYTGLYRDKMYGDAEIGLHDGILSITLIPSKELFNSKMEHWHFDTFRIKFADNFLPEGFITFDKNSYGEMTGFTIDLPNPDFHFYNLKFEKVVD